MTVYNGSAIIAIAAVATTAGSIVMTPTYDVAAYLKNDQLDNAQVKQLELYETPFDRVEYGAYDDKSKLDIVSKFVSTLTRESKPLSAEDHKLITDNLFDLM